MDYHSLAEGGAAGPACGSYSLYINISGDISLLMALLSGVCDIGKTHLSVGSQHFQTVTICHGFISLRFKPLFEFTPIGGGICTFGQNCDNIDNRKIPCFRFVVPEGPHLAFFEKLYRLFLGHGSIYSHFLYPMGRGCFWACGVLIDRAAIA
jgi:hypothetical protein